jgi:hypothetical protein
MASVWLRLERFLGEEKWRSPAERSLTFVASTQRLDGPEGVRGGVTGSYPVSGGYGRFEVLNWATKFFIDALLRLRENRSRTPEGEGAKLPSRLAALP